VLLLLFISLSTQSENFWTHPRAAFKPWTVHRNENYLKQRHKNIWEIFYSKYINYLNIRRNTWSCKVTHCGCTCSSGVLTVFFRGQTTNSIQCTPLYNHTHLHNAVLKPTV
jgi:hypothetical protein